MNDEIRKPLWDLLECVSVQNKWIETIIDGGGCEHYGSLDGDGQADAVIARQWHETAKELLDRPLAQAVYP